MANICVWFLLTLGYPFAPTAIEPRQRKLGEPLAIEVLRFVTVLIQIMMYKYIVRSMNFAKKIDEYILFNLQK